MKINFAIIKFYNVNTLLSRTLYLIMEFESLEYYNLDVVIYNLENNKLFLWGGGHMSTTVEHLKLWVISINLIH